MNFEQKIANFRLGNLEAGQFPDIAITAINEGLSSESLFILAGMNDRDNTFELRQYFNQSIIELEVILPNLIDSAYILMKYYLHLMIMNPSEAKTNMSVIHNNIYYKLDWKKELNISSTKYVGEELGLHYMYTWYRELQDFEDGTRLAYFNDLAPDLQKKQFISKLIIEAKKLYVILNKKDLSLFKQ